MNKQIIYKISSVALIVIAFVISVGFVSHRQSIMPCTGVFVNIIDSSGSGFVEESDIRQIIQNKFGSLEGKSVSSINISLLEKIINTNPFIYDAEVFSTIDGKLKIDVKQRVPLLRIINFNNESFYIDKDGVFMPTSDKFTARVPIANGYIFDKETEKRVVLNSETADTVSSKPKIEQLFQIATYTGKDEFWNAIVQQFYVNSDGDIEFIPRIGNHTVILGDDKQLDEKFDKLEVIYKEALNRKGWDKYSKINLKYKDQVVCTKK